MLLIILIIGCTGSNKTKNLITGTLYISGNEPFAHLALFDDNNNYYKIECSDSLEKELWQLQGNVVNLTCTIKEKTESKTIIFVTDFKLNN